jgi:hypothetical protein
MYKRYKRGMRGRVDYNVTTMSGRHAFRFGPGPKVYSSEAMAVSMGMAAGLGGVAARVSIVGEDAPCLTSKTVVKFYDGEIDLGTMRVQFARPGDDSSGRLYDLGEDRAHVAVKGGAFQERALAGRDGHDREVPGAWSGDRVHLRNHRTATVRLVCLRLRDTEDPK